MFRKPMPERIKVLIVDDHPLFRSGLRQVVAGDPRFELVGETGDGEAALKLILEKKPDVAVLDVNLPGLSGLEIARKLQAKRLPTRVIMLTMHKEEDMVNRALDFGAKGFVLKENAVEEILKAIAAVAEGEHYLSSSISGYLVRRRGRAESLAAKKPGLDDLTKAERRILKLIAEKKTSRANRRGTVHQPAHRRGPPRQHLRQAGIARQPQPVAVRAGKPLLALG